MTNFNYIVQRLAQKLDVELDGGNQPHNLEKLRLKLEEFNLKGGRAVILIDEAHLLSAEALEEIRLLSNLETEKIKLIQIVLVGQNEIYHHLEQEKLRSLKQRIVINRQLSPLGRDETFKYIEHRLKVADRDLALFDQGALKLIWQHSRGTPRLINRLCDNALLIGFAVEARTIGKKIIKEVVSDLDPCRNQIQEDLLNFLARPRIWGVVGVVLLMLAVMQINGFSPMKTTTTIRAAITDTCVLIFYSSNQLLSLNIK